MKIKAVLCGLVLAMPGLVSAYPPPNDAAPPPRGAKADPLDQKTPPRPPPASAATPQTLSHDEVNIVAHIHHVNVSEIDIGKRAKRAGTAAVQRYATMLVADHAAADKALAALAAQKGLAKLPSEKPATEAEQAELKATHDKLAAIARLHGPAFDRAYLQLMIDGHEREIAKNQEMSAIAADPDLAALLAAREATLRRHADAARELQTGTAHARR